MSKNALLICDPAISDLPITATPTNADQWPSSAATELFYDNLIAIVKRGYLGVRVKVAQMSDGSFLTMPAHNLSTPEGRMVRHLLESATAGSQPQTDEVMAKLEQEYIGQGLQLPEPIVSAGDGVTR